MYSWKVSSRFCPALAGVFTGQHLLGFSKNYVASICWCFCPPAFDGVFVRQHLLVFLLSSMMVLWPAFAGIFVRQHLTVFLSASICWCFYWPVCWCCGQHLLVFLKDYVASICWCFPKSQLVFWLFLDARSKISKRLIFIISKSNVFNVIFKLGDNRSIIKETRFNVYLRAVYKNI